MTNKEFAEKDQKFKEDCLITRVIPSKRQASKYRKKKGKVYKIITGKL